MEQPTHTLHTITVVSASGDSFDTSADIIRVGSKSVIVNVCQPPQLNDQIICRIAERGGAMVTIVCVVTRCEEVHERQWLVEAAHVSSSDQIVAA